MQIQNLPTNGVVITKNTVSPNWIDYNGHMNVAYYVMLFDWGIDKLKETVGIDLGYISREKRSTVALESRIAYLSEASLGEQLQVTSRVIDFDGKRVHYYQEMHKDGQQTALSETLSISFDTARRRTCDFENTIARNYEILRDAQHTLPHPEWVARKISIRRN